MNLENEISKNNFDFILIDAMNYVRKYDWVMKDIKTNAGVKTGIIYGILNFVCSLKIKYKKSSIVFCWDSSPSKKKSLDCDYKANRKHLDMSDLWRQIRELKLLLSFFNVIQYYAEGYEADDVAAKISKEKTGKKILLVSSDKDWFQMMEDNDNVFILQNNIIYNKREIEKRDEINIDKYCIFKSIVGSKKNNINGISRMNKKFVWGLMKRVNSIDDIFCLNLRNNMNYNKILESEVLIKKNYKLVRLLDSGFKIQEIERINDKRKLLTKLKELEMNHLIDKIKEADNE